VVEDRPGEHDAEHAAGAEDRRHPRRAARDTAGVELVADDSEREREDRSCESLDRARGDHHRERRGQCRHERARRKRAERPEQDDPPPVHVAEPAGQRGGHGGCEQERGEDPRGARRGRVQPELERRQRRHHERLHERVSAAGQHEHREQQAGAPAGRRISACLPHACSSVTGWLALGRERQPADRI
jgi:hypothetical protein